MSGGELNFRVLGPMVAELGGEPVDLGAPQLRVLLAVLLCQANQTVAFDTLAEALWDDRPPRSYRTQLQGLVSDLRRRLAAGGHRPAAPVVTRGGGYAIEVPPDRLDLDRFRALVDRARAAATAGDTVTAARLLDAALAEWRGPAFADVPAPVVRATAAALDGMRIAAVEEHVQARIDDGRLAGLTDELPALIAEHPQRERLHGHLITVYARTGRPDEARRVYREMRTRLVAELGLEPSAQLERLYRELLSDDAAGPAPATVYADLPPDPPNFTGRSDEVAAVLGVAAGAPTTAVPIVTVEGMAGVGKSRLAVHAAHRLVEAGRYGDARLHVDLRGFSPGGEPADPGAVLESFLRLLGVPPDRIPAGRPARAAVFRDRLAGRHALVLLDNAFDEEQVEPLLPASPTCLVLITSRRSLAIEGARTIRLDPFSPGEALALLTAVAGAESVAAEPEAAAALAVHCGHLPLAVAIAAQGLRGGRDGSERPIADLVERLGGGADRLGELAGAHQVFALSYRALGPAHRRLFRLLGLHPGNDCTPASAAALAALDPAGAEQILEALLDDHLLQQVGPGRYGLHDLLRAFAARLCGTEDTPGQRRDAAAGLLNWYLHAADAASAPLRRYPVAVRRDIAPTTTPVPVVTGPAQGLAWLDAEYANLMAVQRFAAAEGWPDHTVQLPHVMQPYLVRRNHVDGWLVSLRLAEAAARRVDDPRARAYTLTDLGHAHSVAGRGGPGAALLREALREHRTLGDRYGEAVTLGHLAWLQHRDGDYGGSLDTYRTALRGYEAADEPRRQATTLSTMGVQLHLLGRQDEALDHLDRALRIHQRLGDQAGEASLRTNLGRMYGRLGRHREAVEQATAALMLHRDTGSGPGQAYCLASLCVSHAHLGRHDDAIDAGRRAAALVGAAREVRVTVLNSLGEAYLLAGRPDAAAAEHRVALDIAHAIGYADEAERAERGIAAATAHLAAAASGP